VTDYLQDGEAYRTLADGTVIKVRREEVDGVMRDGQRMRVPVMMLDGSSPPPFSMPRTCGRVMVRCRKASEHSPTHRTTTMSSG
jgi:hypothetical protein